MSRYEYRGMAIDLPEHNREHREFFEYASRHQLVVQRCSACGKLRWEPGGACPYCQSLEWQPVSGKGTIYSYEIVAQAIQPGFKDWAPYPVVLVELDEQRGFPGEHDGLRMVTNLVDGDMSPEREENIAIGKRVEVVFLDVAEGFSLPQFRLSDEQPERNTWQFRNE